MKQALCPRARQSPPSFVHRLNKRPTARIRSHQPINHQSEHILVYVHSAILPTPVSPANYRSTVAEPMFTFTDDDNDDEGRVDQWLIFIFMRLPLIKRQRH